MVAGAGGDHQERDAMLRGNPGHQRLGAVTPGDPEEVRAPGHGLPGHFRHIDRLRAVHQEHLGAQLLGLALQVEPAHLPAPRPGVHDQERVAGRRPRRMLGHPPVLLVPGQRPARRHGREHPQRRRHDRHPQRVGERVRDDQGDRREDERRRRQPPQHAPPGEEDERRAQAHHGGHHAGGQPQNAVPVGDHQHDYHGRHCEY